MVHWVRERFKVGKEGRFDPIKIELEGIVSIRSSPSPGTAILSPGISAHYEDYHAVLDPLAEEFDVVAFNHRGHGESDGRFNPNLLGDDLDSIIEEDTVVLAHSIIPFAHSVGAMGSSCSESNIKAIFMVNPYFGPEFIAMPQRFILHLARLATYLRAHVPIQGVLSYKDIGEKIGFHNRELVIDYAELSKVSQSM